MNIVSNSSPLIFLSKIGKLHVLEKLFDKVYIAQTVYNETVLSAKSNDITGQITQSILNGHFIRFNVKNELAVKTIRFLVSLPLLYVKYTPSNFF